MNERGEKNPRTLKEAISLVLNAESLMQERTLCSRMSQQSSDLRLRRPFEAKRFEDPKRKPWYGNNYRPAEGERVKSKNLLCNFCRNPGHPEDLCYDKQQGFCSKLWNDRPPSNRVVIEMVAGVKEQKEKLEEADEGLEPYEWEQQEVANSSYNCDPEESTRPFDLVDSRAEASIIKHNALNFSECKPQ